MNNVKKTSYYVGIGIAFGSLFGGLFSTVFGKYKLVIFLGGIACGGLIGLIYGKIKNNK
ncbi:MAG: hypothetical protein E6871_09430 [Streptococcus anginosus]|nr:hypothetical protein [Streptococcus anginosus]